MKEEIVFSVTRRDLRWFLAAVIAVLLALTAPHLVAQKVQEDFSDKFKVATEDGGVAIAASADGRYVYIVGKKGLIVSDDHGKTGTWVQTLRLK